LHAQYELVIVGYDVPELTLHEITRKCKIGNLFRIINRYFCFLLL